MMTVILDMIIKEVINKHPDIDKLSDKEKEDLYQEYKHRMFNSKIVIQNEETKK